jgi:beta-D-xylosidase 4
MLGGKSDYYPENIVSVCEGIASRGAPGTVVCDGSNATKPDPSILSDADVVVVAVGGIFGSEEKDRVNISLPEEQQMYINEVVSVVGAAKVVLVVVNGDPIALDTFKNNIPTIVDALEGGQAAGTGLASVLFGDVSPSAMLPFTIYPDEYVTKVMMSDMAMRANQSTGSPGRTVKAIPPCMCLVHPPRV